MKITFSSLRKSLPYVIGVLMFGLGYITAHLSEKTIMNEQYKLIEERIYDDTVDSIRNEILKEGLDKETVFQNSKACADSYGNIWDEINQLHLPRNRLDPVIEEVFYSQTDNECMYVFRSRWSDLCGLDGLSREEQLTCLRKDKHLFSYTTKKHIASQDENLSILWNECMDRADLETDEKTQIRIKDHCDKNFMFSNIIDRKKGVEYISLY